MKRGSPLSPLPIIPHVLFPSPQPPYNPAISIFTKIPSESLCREERFENHFVICTYIMAFFKTNLKECELAMKSTSLLACFLVDIYGQVEVIAYF